MSDTQQVTGVKERLSKFIEHKGLSQAKFERACGLANGFVNSVGKSIRGETLNKISVSFSELNRSWLLLGEEPMIKPHEYTGTVPQEQKSPDHPSEEMIRAQIENKLLREQLAELKEELRKAMEKNAELKYRRDNHL